MGILNKRNAVLGWGAWKVGKRVANRKARQKLEPDSKRPGKRTLLGGLAAAGGALWFWRRSRGDSED
jgi:hypothetical protein